MHRIILISLMLLTLAVGSNAANPLDQKQKAILVTAVALSANFAAMAGVPCSHPNGSAGTIAPIEKSANDVAAALSGLLPSSAGSIPSSSRASALDGRPPW
jgi:hypothetical protein